MISDVYCKLSYFIFISNSTFRHLDYQDDFVEVQEKMMSERKRNIRRICNVFNLTESSKPRRKTVDYHLLCIKEYKVS